MNAGLADQLRATNRDLLRNVRAFAAAGGYEVYRGSDPWMESVVEALRANMVAGKVKVCPHVRASPMPLITAAWRLGALVCGMCIGVFDLSHDPIADSTCDRCGIMTAGEIHPSAFVVGVVLVTYGACRRCHNNLKGA
jgi:hypothetical protein